MTETSDPIGLGPLTRSNTALFNMFRRSGQPVTSPVSLALNGGTAYFVTATDSGKAKRLTHTERVELTPCTAASRPIGGTVAGRARPVAGGARPSLRGVMRPTGPLFWSWLLYRIRNHRMFLFQVEPHERRRPFSLMTCARRSHAEAAPNGTETTGTTGNVSADSAGCNAQNARDTKSGGPSCVR